MMWLYETLAHAVRDGARYAAVHGEDCAISPNSCAVAISDIANQIQNSGVGLVADDLQITISILVPGSATVLVSDGPETLTSALSDGQAFSGWTYTSVGNTVSASAPGRDVVVKAVMPFKSALSMFWPGAGRVSFDTVNLAATSRERIGF